jgi:Domain of unknown function (DUF1906)
MHWGVDSARPANTTADDGVMIAFDAVAGRAGSAPEFWGRYIGGNYAVTAVEIQYLHGLNCRVFLTYNDTSAADVQGTAQDGKGDAASAIAAALALGAPAGMAIFADVENSWVPSADWIQGWVTGIVSDANGYLPGFYCDATPGKAFDIAYCGAVANEPAVGAAFVWSMEPQPNPQCQATIDSPVFNPNNVSCGNPSSMWQYTMDCWEDLLGASAGVDMDQATDTAFQAMWAAPGPLHAESAVRVSARERKKSARKR